MHVANSRVPRIIDPFINRTAQFMSNKLSEEIRSNKSVNRFHSFLLILAMVAILALVGLMLFGFWGFVFAVGIACASMIFGRRVSIGWVMRMYKAKPLQKHQAPELFEIFGELVAAAKLDHVPRLYYVPSRLPNAFATGFNKETAVAVTDGILRMMNRREIRGILAHEVAHLMHGDTSVMALADTMARLVATVCRLGVFMLLFSGLATLLTTGITPGMILAGLLMFFAPSIMILLQLALSRTREFNADLGAVQLSGDALALASALTKLERMVNPKAGIWGKIVRPGQKRAQPAFLRTHPPTDERVERLLEHAPESAIEPVRAPVATSPRKLTFKPRRIRERPRYRLGSGSWR